MDQAPLAPPSRGLFLLEGRAAFDAARMLPPLFAARFAPREARSDALVIVVPGFGSGDRYTLPLRRYLSRLGYKTEGWGLGTNLAGSNIPHTLDDLSERWTFEDRSDYSGEAGVPLMIDRLYDRVVQRHRETGRSIALVGWSLGGYMAREVARDLPGVVTQVVTMGSPIIGGPKYTAVASFFDRGGQDLDWIEREIRNRESRPITQPITAIYSKTDGIVEWRATIDRFSPDVRHIEVNASHLGMGFNARIWREVVLGLEREGVS